MPVTRAVFPSSSMHHKQEIEHFRRACIVRGGIRLHLYPSISHKRRHKQEWERGPESHPRLPPSTAFAQKRVKAANETRGHQEGVPDSEDNLGFSWFAKTPHQSALSPSLLIPLGKNFFVSFCCTSTSPPPPRRFFSLGALEQVTHRGPASAARDGDWLSVPTLGRSLL